MNQISVGPNTAGRHDKKPKGLYGGRSNGKVSHNGGFGGQPFTGFSSIPQENWDRINWEDDGKDG